MRARAPSDINQIRAFLVNHDGNLSADFIFATQELRAATEEAKALLAPPRRPRPRLVRAIHAPKDFMEGCFISERGLAGAKQSLDEMNHAMIVLRTKVSVDRGGPANMLTGPRECRGYLRAFETAGQKPATEERGWTHLALRLVALREEVLEIRLNIHRERKERGQKNVPDIPSSLHPPPCIRVEGHLS